jgi:NAD(P)-dependent dehydrogenase (short-subunit alcohol dehydrogenase family)
MLYVTHVALPHLVRAAAGSPRRVADLVTISSTAGRLARPGSSVYNLTKFGAAAFSEALRQEMLSRRVRVSVIEPHHPPPRGHPAGGGQPDGLDRAAAARRHRRHGGLHRDRDRRVAVNEILIRPGEQTW